MDSDTHATGYSSDPSSYEYASVHYIAEHIAHARDPHPAFIGVTNRECRVSKPV